MSISNSSTVPINMLPGIGKRTAEVLQSLDIRTVGQFKCVPEKLLIALFGPSIHSIYAYVHNKPVHTSRTTVKQLRTGTKKRLSTKNKFKVASLMFSFMH